MLEEHIWYIIKEGKSRWTWFREQIHLHSRKAHFSLRTCLRVKSGKFDPRTLSLDEESAKTDWLNAFTARIKDFPMHTYSVLF